ncbi:hypothetical protein DB313_05825 (plasmid) [Borrelia turcica IST7]|uniref:Uncharacterized protein n=1 Tax=Borrelia turcica IST7 TaxID=1104446 RepID=A0A386PQ73_9SPIR|nr:plasmid maintenance protein [Borrelia turcica]AYE37019.1 hypothetical protein DB313_05825 [Borrelia turcica IST7]
MRQEKISKMPFNKVVDRRLKVFWVIQKLRCNYFQNNRKYSLKNVVMMVNSILEKKGFKKVTKRTIQNDIKNFEKIGLLKTDFNPLGKNNGSFTHYIINKTLEKIANKAISKAYFIEKKNKKVQARNKATKRDKLEEKNQKFKISHQIFSHLLSEKEVINNKNKNSKMKTIEDKGEALEKTILYKYKEVQEKDLNEMKEIVKTKVSYKNTLWNLKDFMEELIEYEERAVLSFFKNTLKKKKNKIWFMSKRNTNTDFDMIIGEFKDKNKTKKQEIYKNTVQVQSPKMNYIDNPNDIRRASELVTNIMNLRAFN